MSGSALVEAPKGRKTGNEKLRKIRGVRGNKRQRRKGVNVDWIGTCES